MKSISCSAILIFLLFAVSAQASDAIVGYVKTAKGEALIVREKKAATARINDKIFRNDVLKTGEKSSLGVSFKDDTLIALGSNSELIVSEFNFSPAEGRLGMFMKMLKGSVVYLSGIIAKLSPEAVRFSTPVGDLFLRGTRFAVQIEGE